MDRIWRSPTPWVIPSDIPAESAPVHRWTFASGRTLTFTGEFGGEYRSAVRLGPKELWETLEDPLHPLGRCTCGGEGRCEWCTRPCPTCGELTAYHGDKCLEDDYEALGYPETEAGYEHRPELLETILSTVHACIECGVRCYPLSPITNNQDDIENG